MIEDVTDRRDEGSGIGIRLVVAIRETGCRMRAQSGRQLLEGGGPQGIVRVEEGDRVATRAIQTGVARDRGVARVQHAHQLDGLLAKKRGGAIGRAVVHDDDFAGSHGLRHDAGERPGDKLTPLVGGQDDGDHRRKFIRPEVSSPERSCNAAP